jgi:hypothetical protein
MPAQVVFRTQGAATSFVNTTNPLAIFLTPGAATAFLSTYQPTSLFLTGGIKSSFLTTNASFPAFLTASQAVAFFTTADIGTTKLLVPTIGTLEVSSGYTYVNVPDATGDYNALTNPGGYNILPLPYNAARPYRDNVALWTVYRIWNVYGAATQSPDEQNEQYDPSYTYQLFFPTETNAAQEEEVIKGVYEIILIAAPYWNETNTGGTYVSSSALTYHLVNGLETNFTALVAADFLYYVDETTGDLLEIEEVNHVFSDTLLNLAGAPINTPSEGARLYGSNTQITTAINSGGTVESFTSAEYTPVVGSGTDFTTLTTGYTLFYIEAATGDYKPMGTILNYANPLTTYLIDVTENVATNGEVLVAYSANEVPVINSQGTFDQSSSVTVLGTNTQFTLFTPGQTLFYQDATTGQLTDVGVIDTITNDTELTVVSAIVNTPTQGDRLYASDNASVSIEPSNGIFSSYGTVSTYYTLTGTGTNFNSFSAADYTYIVSENNYAELGQISFIQSATSMVFYSPNAIDVAVGSFIVASPTQISLIDISGTFASYETDTYYNVVGSGTTFLSTAEQNQYLFYQDANGQYIKTGQIFQVFDDTNVWLYEAPEGSPDNTTQLFTSYSLNTETASYANYQGNFDLYQIAKQFPGWFVGSTGLIVDSDLINCLARMRYEYLQSVMCGKCDESYLHTYSLYVGMLNAMEVQEWLLAVELYDKLKVICAEQSDGASCGC